MATSAEIAGTKMVAESMSIKDLEWQIANQKKLRIPDAINNIFKQELAKKKAKTG